MQLAYRHDERPGESYEALDGKKHCIIHGIILGIGMAVKPDKTMLSGDVLGLNWRRSHSSSQGQDLLRSLLKPSQLSSVDLSVITATSLSVCPSQDHGSSATM